MVGTNTLAMAPTIWNPNRLKTDLQNVRFSYDSGFWMVGFRIPTVIDTSSFRVSVIGSYSYARQDNFKQNDNKI